MNAFFVCPTWTNLGSAFLHCAWEFLQESYQCTIVSNQLVVESDVVLDWENVAQGDPATFCTQGMTIAERGSPYFSTAKYTTTLNWFS